MTDILTRLEWATTGDDVKTEAIAEIKRLRAEGVRARTAELAWERHCKEAEARVAVLERALNPMRWTVDQSRAWHRAIPDVHAAFAALRELALADARGAK